MKNRMTLGFKQFQKVLVWFLIATLLITMLPLTGLFFSNYHQGGTHDFMSVYTAHAASYPTSGECGDSARWNYNKKSGALTISGSGEMWDWEDPLDEESEYIAPWVAYYYDSIKTITINNGITAIGTYSFAECLNVKGVSIPGSVRHIMEGAFQECSSLSSVSIPNGVETIEAFAFAFCDSLTGVTLPVSVRDVSSMAFFYCDTLERISITSGNRYYKDVNGVVFTSNDDKLVIYPTAKKDHVYSIPGQAYRISEYAFAYNKYLRAVLMTDNMTYLEQGAFAYNENLIRFYTPGGLRQISDDCFIGCNKLTDIYSSGDQYSRNMVAVGKNNSTVWSAEWHYKGTREDCLTALFEDVQKKAYYYQPVQWAAKNNITSGTSDITFSPNTSCNRAQMVTFLWRAAGSPEPASMDLPFTDVKVGGFYEKAVAWAVENNITNGVSDDKFGPDLEVTRGQTVTFLYRLDHPKENPDSSGEQGNDTPSDNPDDNGDASSGTPSDNPDDTLVDLLSDDGGSEQKISFTDVANDAYYYDAVYWAADNKITNGTTPTTFEPGAVCTRGQIVTFLYRYMEEVKKTS